MSALTFFDHIDQMAHGSTYDPEHDRERLGRQLQAVLTYLRTHDRATLRQLSGYSGGSEAGCSARIRDLRKLGFDIQKERVEPGSGLYQYWLVKP